MDEREHAGTKSQGGAPDGQAKPASPLRKVVRILGAILVCILLIVALLATMIALQPAEFRVARSVLIAAPAPKGGHVGLILNRPTKRQLGSVFPDEPAAARVKDLVYYGGITQNNAGQLWKDLKEAMPGVALMGPDGIYETAFSEAAVSAAEGTYLTFGGTTADQYTGEAAKWRDDYGKKYGVDSIQVYTIYGYEAVNVEAQTRDLSSLLNWMKRVLATRKTSQAFGRGRIQLLVSTTVIEVGVDVPNASLMVIEHAERFGLAQLHQLRGRVGRGGRESVCILLYEAPLSGAARERLRVVYECADGFEVARRDLQLRGPGEWLGERQSGVPLLRFAVLERDAALLEEARDAAEWLLEHDPEAARAHVARWLPGGHELVRA